MVRNTFQLRDPQSQHMGVAVGAVLEGPGFQYDGVWIHLRGNTLHCDAVLRPSESVGDADAFALINRTQEVVRAVASVSPVFASLLASTTTRFGVVDDCATHWRSIVELVNSQLVWARRDGGR